MTLVIMAAGMGSRFGGLKQIEPVGPNGEFIIDYSIYDAIKAGFTKVVFIIKEENYEIFKETVGKRVEDKIEVNYAFQKLENIPEGYSYNPERVKPWGTTHAILACKHLVDEPFAVINADDFYGFDSYKIVHDFLSSTEEDYCMAGYILKNTISPYGTVSRGICETGGDSYLTSIVERKKIGLHNGEICYLDNNDIWVPISGDSLASMNFFGFRPDIFKYLESDFKQFFEEGHGEELTSECLIPITIGKLIDNGMVNLKVLETKATWYGVTNKEDKEKIVEAINNLIVNGEYKENLWEDFNSKKKAI